MQQRGATVSRRDFIRAALAAGVLLPGGIGGLIAEALAQGKARPGVNRMRGDVRVNGEPAKPGTIIKPGDTVTTGPKSYVTFVVGQDAFLVRGDTKLELSGATQTLVNLARVLTGKLLSVYSKGPPRKIEGVTATIGIRGTGAYIEVEPERTYFCLCYGEAEIVPVAAPGASEVVRTRHHESPRYIYGKGRAQVMEKAPVINHRDEELILLESLVGRIPAFLQNQINEFGPNY
jgi:hypothetical protein